MNAGVPGSNLTSNFVLFIFLYVVLSFINYFYFGVCH